MHISQKHCRCNI